MLARGRPSRSRRRWQNRVVDKVAFGERLRALRKERDLTLGEEVRGRPGVRIASESYGAGVYEAVVTTLAERRSR